LIVWIYYKKGNGTLAVNSLEEAVRQGPKTQHLLSARLGLSQGWRSEESAPIFEHALKLDAGFKEAADAKRALATIKG
jgi:hypothetical protein